MHRLRAQTHLFSTVSASTRHMAVSKPALSLPTPCRQLVGTLGTGPCSMNCTLASHTAAAYGAVLGSGIVSKQPARCSFFVNMAYLLGAAGTQPVAQVGGGVALPSGFIGDQHLQHVLEARLAAAPAVHEWHIPATGSPRN